MLKSGTRGEDDVPNVVSFAHDNHRDLAVFHVHLFKCRCRLTLGIIFVVMSERGHIPLICGNSESDKSAKSVMEHPGRKAKDQPPARTRLNSGSETPSNIVSIKVSETMKHTRTSEENESDRFGLRSPLDVLAIVEVVLQRMLLDERHH